MFLLIVRHADAGDRDAFAAAGRPDSERPLSDKGRAQMDAETRALRQLVPECQLIFSSPLVRAAQTAQLLASAWPGATVETTPALEPGSRPEQFAELVGQIRDRGAVAAVGHEPDLGQLATWFMTGLDDSRIAFKKAGACLLEFEGRPAKGKAELRWLMGPKHLAALRQG